MRPLPQRADEPLRRDPRPAGTRPPAGRHDAALARRRADAALHGHLDVRRVHGDAGDRPREGVPGGAARGLRPVRVRPLDRDRRGAEHRRRRRRARRAWSSAAASSVSERSSAAGSPARSGSSRSTSRRSGSRGTAPRRDRHPRRRRRHGRLDPRRDRRIRRRLHLRGDRERRRHAAGGRGGARGMGPRDDVRRRRQGRDRSRSSRGS